MKKLTILLSGLSMPASACPLSIDHAAGICSPGYRCTPAYIYLKVQGPSVRTLYNRLHGTGHRIRYIFLGISVLMFIVAYRIARSTWRSF